MPARPYPSSNAVVPHAASSDATRLRVVVTDAVGLQRVLTMLSGRQHPFTRLEAEEAGGGRWSVQLDLVAAPPQVALVTARLHRLPSVLTVDVTAGGRLATSA